MKRIISERFVTYAAKRLPFLLTLLMSLVVTTISAHDIEVVNDDGITLYYKWMNNNTELAVSYRGDTPNQYINYKQEFSGDIVIPESVTYNGKTYSVTSIGEGAFYFCGYMTSVTIPNSVKSIGELAFERCNGLTSLTIGNSVKTIGKYVFSSCSSLSSVSIPDNVTFIDEYAFSNSSGLQSITIGSGIETIEKNVFSYYASKEGYIDSEVARANCQIIGGKFGDLTGDGCVDVADHVKLSEIIMNPEH